jgi:hypothetical protein
MKGSENFGDRFMKGEAKVLGILGVIGLGLMGGGSYYRWQTEKFLRSAISTDGLVTEIIKREYHGKYSRSLTPSYFPRVSFRTKEGRSVIFIPTAASGQSDYRRNQTVPVVYDPREPQHAYIRSSRDLFGPSGFLFGAGILFFLPGIAYVISRPVHNWRSRRADAKKAWLLQNGRRILAQNPRVERKTKGYGYHPYRITCEWLDPATNRTYSFGSPDIFYDPAVFLPKKSIEVTINPNNPGSYFMDISFLPKMFWSRK